jgi:PAS domain S-box-containing protein
MLIASTPEMATGKDRRSPPPALSDTRRPVALVSRSDGRVISANAACERLFGYAPGALEDRHLSELSAAPARSPEDRAHTIAREIAATGVWSGESQGLRADGTSFPCIVSLSEIDGAEPRSRVWVASFTPT